MRSRVSLKLRSTPAQEDWQKEAAAQLAAEAEEEERHKEEEKKQKEEEARKLKEAEKQKGAPQLNMPDRVDLSIDEAKALFKVKHNMLRCVCATFPSPIAN